MTLALILKIALMLPSLLPLLLQFKGATGWGLLKIIAEIIRMILAFAPKDKIQANAFMQELKDTLANAPDKDKLQCLHDKVKGCSDSPKDILH